MPLTIISNPTKPLICALVAVLTAVSAAPAQEAKSGAAQPAKRTVAAPAATSAELAPMTLLQASAGPAQPAATAPVQSTTVQAAAAPASAPAAAGAETTTTTTSVTESGGIGVREFQGDDVGQVLRLLARQAKINMVVSEAVAGTVTRRLEDVTALQRSRSSSNPRVFSWIRSIRFTTSKPEPADFLFNSAMNAIGSQFATYPSRKYDHPARPE